MKPLISVRVLNIVLVILLIGCMVDKVNTLVSQYLESHAKISLDISNLEYEISELSRKTD